MSNAKKLPIVGKTLAIGFGLTLAIAVVLLLISLFPGLIGKQDPFARSQRGESLEINYYVTSGDMFGYMPGKIRPPASNDLLASFIVNWDENGFRIPARPADSYSIVAIGDSFTEAPIINTPWVDLLAESLDTPIANYGYRGYGPVESARTAQEFAFAEGRTPEWILYAWFAGNDLYDVGRSQAIQERSATFLLEGVLDQAADNLEGQIEEAINDQYDFPLPVIIGGNFYEMAFLADFLWAQLPPEHGFGSSQNYMAVDTILGEIAAYDACKALIFIPTKEQLYYQYIVDSERRWMRGLGQVPVLDGDGWLELQEAPIAEGDEAQVMQAFDAQRKMLRDLADQHSYLFIDLVPAFQQAVAEGRLLYYRYDTHWNPNGHALAAEVIAEALRSQDCPG